MSIQKNPTPWVLWQNADGRTSIWELFHGKPLQSGPVSVIADPAGGPGLTWHAIAIHGIAMVNDILWRDDQGDSEILSDYTFEVANGYPTYSWPELESRHARRF
jgi:hypothetical protein